MAQYNVFDFINCTNPCTNCRKEIPVIENFCSNKCEKEYQQRVLKLKLLLEEHRQTVISNRRALNK